MNSLEFVENEINLYKNAIKISSDKQKKTYYKQTIKTLQQIKFELEAWYVVKGTIVEGEDGNGHYCYIETVYFTGEKGKKVKKGLYNDETR